MLKNPNKSLVWIDTLEKFNDCLTPLLQSAQLAVDIEADSLYHYHEKVCLIQISSHDTDLLIDPLAFNAGPQINSLLENTTICKIFHGADFDLRSMNRDFATEASHIFDTKIAAELLGISKLGLIDLVETYFGVRLNKKYQKYNWSRRPLDPQAMTYAVQDTRYLVPLREVLSAELLKMNRMEWACQEFEFQASARWKPSKNAAIGFWKIPGVLKMSAHQKVQLHALWVWRDHLASHIDVPVFKIMNDQTILNLISSADALPNDPDTIGKMLPHHIAHYRNDICQLLIKSDAGDISTLPKQPLHRYEKLLPRQQKQLKWLRDHRDHVAEQLGISPGLLISRDAMTELVKQTTPVLDMDAAHACRAAGLRRWQWEQLTGKQG